MRKITLRFAATLVLVVFAGPNPALSAERYEIWAIDQSNSPGLTYGGTIHIYDGHTLENGRNPAEAVPEKIDLAAASMCFAKTGVNSNLAGRSYRNDKFSGTPFWE